MDAGLHNFGLSEYLVGQVLQSSKHRFGMLRTLYPGAEEKDWKLEAAGMRVQIIKRDRRQGGILEFGTEIVAAHDHSLVALLGASPGASTAASIMIRVIELCFAEQLNAGAWKTKMQDIIPSYGHSLIEDAALTRQVRADTAAVLGLQNV
jgi:malate dehydrogenase (quinone)